MTRGQLVAVSEERLLEMQEAQELAARASGAAMPREVPSLPTLRAQLSRGRDLLRKPLAEDDLLPTALPAVDPLLAGGLARGCLTELRGSLSSGRFGLVLALLAATTARGETAAIVDLGDQLDPQDAARCGVVLERLLWARPQRLREALAAAEIALGGDFPLVVLELGLPPLPYGSRDEHAWLRLARAARLHRAALLVATPWRITGSAAGEVLALGRRGGVWLGNDQANNLANNQAPRLLAGVEGRLVREKSRRQSEPAAANAGATPFADLGLRVPSLLGPLPARGRGQGTRLLPETLRSRQQERPHGGPEGLRTLPPRSVPAWPRSTKVAAQQQSLLPPDVLPDVLPARSIAARAVAAAASPAEPRPFASQL